MSYFYRHITPLAEETLDVGSVGYIYCVSKTDRMWVFVQGSNMFIASNPSKSHTPRSAMSDNCPNFSIPNSYYSKAEK